METTIWYPNLVRNSKTHTINRKLTREEKEQHIVDGAVCITEKLDEKAFYELHKRPCKNEPPYFIPPRLCLVLGGFKLTYLCVQDEHAPVDPASTWEGWHIVTQDQMEDKLVQHGFRSPGEGY